MIRLVAKLFVVAALLMPASCSERAPFMLNLTLDGKAYASYYQQDGSWFTSASSNTLQIEMCVRSSDPALVAVGDGYCLAFVLAGNFSDTLVTPASLRVVGTAAVVDPSPGVPTTYSPVFTFAGGAEHAPEIQSAYMRHDQSSASWDGDQQQQLDGILRVEHASKTELQVQVDIDVVGTLPPATFNTIVHAHMSGPFGVTDPHADGGLN